MINFKQKESLLHLTGEDEDIEVSISERDFKEENCRFFSIYVARKNDVTFGNCIDLSAETLEDAKLLAQDAVDFLKRNMPALYTRKTAVDNKG
jgi:uncharacterized OsmC-like protein